MTWDPILLVKVDENLEKSIEREEKNIEKWIDVKSEYENKIKEILEREIENLEKANRELENPLTRKQISELAEKRIDEERWKLWRELDNKREKMNGDLLDKLLKLKENIKGLILKIEGKNYTYIYTEYSKEAEVLIKFFKKNHITYFVIEWKMTKEENPWFNKAKELEEKLEEERTKSAKLVMNVERIIVEKMQEMIKVIDRLYYELESEREGELK